MADISALVIEKIQKIIDVRRNEFMKNGLIGYHNTGRGFQLLMFRKPMDGIEFVRGCKNSEFTFQLPYLKLDDRFINLSEDLRDAVLNYDPTKSAVGFILVADGEECTFKRFTVIFNVTTA